MVAHSKAAPLVESFGVHNLPLGGTNGYKGVRKHRKGFRGYSPKKRHVTRECSTAQEAAVERVTQEAAGAQASASAAEAALQAKYDASEERCQNATSELGVRDAASEAPGRERGGAPATR